MISTKHPPFKRWGIPNLPLHMAPYLWFQKLFLSDPKTSIWTLTFWIEASLLGRGIIHYLPCQRNLYLNLPDVNVFGVFEYHPSEGQKCDIETKKCKVRRNTMCLEIKNFFPWIYSSKEMFHKMCREKEKLKYWVLHRNKQLWVEIASAFPGSLFDKWGCAIWFTTYFHVDCR